MGGPQIPVRFLQIQLGVGRQQLGHPATLPLPHPQLHQPLVPDDAPLVQAKLLTHPLRRLPCPAEGAGVDRPVGGLGQELGQTGPHGEGLGFSLGGQLGVATPLQPQFGVVTGLTMAQQIEGSRHGFSSRVNEIRKQGEDDNRCTGSTKTRRMQACADSLSAWPAAIVKGRQGLRAFIAQAPCAHSTRLRHGPGAPWQAPHAPLSCCSDGIKWGCAGLSVTGWRPMPEKTEFLL